MTPARKKHLEYAQFLLNDSADDKSLPAGTRERLRMMAARIGIEWEAAEGVANSRYVGGGGGSNDDDAEDAEPAFAQKHRYGRKSMGDRCSGGYSNHNWSGMGVCLRCGTAKS